jgi:peptide subunit release factor RF-3
VRLDWTAIERKRGISVSSAVMSSEHGALAFKLLGTPEIVMSAYRDFSTGG